MADPTAPNEKGKTGSSPLPQIPVYPIGANLKWTYVHADIGVSIDLMITIKNSRQREDGVWVYTVENQEHVFGDEVLAENLTVVHNIDWAGGP